MKGVTTRDVEHYNPRCNARGVIKTGTPVVYKERDGWAGWIVVNRSDAMFMSASDWRYSYVDVPADAVQVTPT